MIVSRIRETKRDVPRTGFEASLEDPEIVSFFDDWDLHSRFAELHSAEGGDRLSFNGSPVRLDIETVLLLEYDLISRRYTKDERKLLELMEMCRFCRESMDKGRKVYYYGIW